MINRSAWSLRESGVFFFAITASIFLSLWIIYHQDIVNPDAICYLLGAEEVGMSGIKGTMHLCGQAQWPFYPVLIYGFAKWSHFSYLFAAHVLDSFFSLLTVLTFILIVKELGGSRRIVWLAAGVILLAHSFNSVREYIIRDHGFWSFYLMSVLVLLRYVRKPQFMTAFLWSISVLIATLFRIEGIFFLVAMPFISWFCLHHSFKQRLMGFFALNFSLIIICFMIAFLFFYHPDQTLEKFGRLSELPYQVNNGLMLIVKRYQLMQAALAQYVLGPDAKGQAGPILAIVFITWYLISIMSNLSWVYVLLFIYTLWNRTVSLASHAKLVLYSYLGINIVVTFAFLLERHFLSKRYLIALSLVFMLWIPFGLDHFIQRSSRLRHHLQLILLVALVLFTGSRDFYDRGHSKIYIEEAGNWIATHIPVDATLYINDYQLMFYTKRFGNKIFAEFQRQVKQRDAIAQADWKQYDFLALRLSKNDTVSSIAALLLPIQVFNNKHGDRVVIYKVKA